MVLFVDFTVRRLLNMLHKRKGAIDTAEKGFDRVEWPYLSTSLNTLAKEGMYASS